MGAAHVKRGGGARTRSRKPAPRVAVPKKFAKKLAVEQQQANRLATWAFGLFALGIAIVTLVALDVPAKIGLAAGEAVLTPDEKELGVAIVDIGGGSCELIVGANARPLLLGTSAWVVRVSRPSHERSG